jgi:hypothetical protein
MESYPPRKGIYTLQPFSTVFTNEELNIFIVQFIILKLKLKKEREEIMLFLDSLEEQLKKGAISIGEFENVKKENFLHIL